MAGGFAFAQNTYIDVTTTLALKLYSDNLENQQEKTIEQQTKLQQAQTWVSTQTVSYTHLDVYKRQGWGGACIFLLLVPTFIAAIF